MSCICLIEPRSIEKTTSGKIARSWCRRAFLNSSLKLLHKWDILSSGEEEFVPLQYSQSAAAGADGNDNVDVSVENVETAEAARTLGPRLTAEEVRALSEAEILTKLENALLVVNPNLSSPIDPEIYLRALGLDSMPIVQYNGLIEKRYPKLKHCFFVFFTFSFCETYSLLDKNVCTLKGSIVKSQMNL